MENPGGTGYFKCTYFRMQPSRAATRGAEVIQATDTPTTVLVSMLISQAVECPPLDWCKIEGFVICPLEGGVIWNP